MRVVVRIDVLAMQANWPRSARLAFASQLEAALTAQVLGAADRGAFVSGSASARERLSFPASALASPRAASSALAGSITAAIAGRSVPRNGAGARR